MQTFLPFPDFILSTKYLDYKRLGNQRVEAKQILNALKTGKGWIHHPATKMWRGYEDALGAYMNICIYEWLNRGYKNTMELYKVPEIYMAPPWIGDERFHRSHRSNLLRKDPEFYGQYNWKEPNDLPYFWPTKDEKYKKYFT
jgi:hypothetical protein